MAAKWKVTAKHTENILTLGAEAVVEQAVDLANPDSPREYLYDIEHVDTHECRRVFSHRTLEVGAFIEEGEWSRDV
ncbi:hypothetical protein [Marimonas lutisalis]|uniref:hypothetical protein n=1 Tax=Marimonas lutisalis TaxID=2545756 RepID=UPI0010F5A1E8|nr:hypothetical protein [Marimonas lutisalis]